MCARKATPSRLVVSVSKKDAARLTPHLANYGKLNEMLVMNTVTDADLQRMILIEVAGKNRKVFIRKLVGRYMSRRRRAYILELEGKLP